MLTLFFCTWLPPTKLTHLKPPGRCPISASYFSNKVASHCSRKNHCGNFRSSAPPPPRSVNGQPCMHGKGSMQFFSGFGKLESPQTWVRPQLPFGRSPPPPCNCKTLLSSHSPPLPILPVPFSPNTPWCFLQCSGRGRPSLENPNLLKLRSLDPSYPFS